MSIDGVSPRRNTPGSALRFRRVGATEHQWHLLFYNCNNFAIEVVQWLGLRAPSAMLLPRAFIDELRDLNGR
jgi:hypothetical protein